MSASFQIKQEGVDHQMIMPEVALPETLTNGFEQMEEIRLTSPVIYQRLKMFLPEVFEFRPIKKITSELSKNNPPYSSTWIKTIGNVESDVRLQQSILAYASDYNILTTATLPHREQLNKKNTFYASLDHAIWFHREFNLQDWLLYSMDSPSASNSRGFARGSLFDKNGTLVASVAQEGLIRQS